MKSNGTNPYFSTHVHSNFSTIDGMSRVEDLVERAATYNQPAMALTDHGLMSGTVQLYKACQKYNLKPFPGTELYVMDPKLDASNYEDAEGTIQRYHLGALALNFNGYKGLVKLNTLSFTRPRFSRFPRLLLDDLIEFGAEYGKDIAITSGCVFGLFEKTLIDEGFDSARGILQVLQGVTPNLFVEIQRHNIPDSHSELAEDSLIEYSIGLADELGLPIIATPDSHYLDQSQKKAHALMKRMVYGGVEDEFPGDSFHLPSTGWMKEKFSPEIWSRVEESCQSLLDQHSLIIPELENYIPHVPKMSDDADSDLKKMCYKSLFKIIGAEPGQEYIDRLTEELRVVSKIKMADYFLLVLDSVEYIKGKSIPIEARGSANGSLICFLLGITQIDPLIYSTNFPRFLAEDRIGTPDVDIDIADKDRWVVLEYLSNLEINGVKYKTSQIGTFGHLGQNKDDPNDTGSAFNTYVSYIKRTYMEKAWDYEKAKAEAEGRKPVKAQSEKQGGIDYNMSPDSKIKKLEDVKDVRPEDYAALKQIIGMNSVYKSKGTHAGGILVSGEHANIEEYVPLMLIPGAQGKDTIVTQYTMKDVEQLGLLKMDWLGQTSLSVMQKCQEFIGKEDILDFTWIPFDDRKTLQFATSRKNHPGCFHAENYPKSVALAELKPKSTKDFVIWQAYSMPGATDSGAAQIYLDRRQNKVTDYGYQHPVLKSAFDGTMGVMIFQEAVLEICRGIGMTGAELTNFFKVVKDSGSGAVERNQKRLAESKPRFVELATNAGLSTEEIEWVWKQIVAMGGYAFSINHSAGYGVRSYRTFYLKCHYPVEYMGALLYCWAGSNTQVKKFGKKISKETVYLQEAEKMKIRILEPSINKSDANWKVERGGKALRKGFLSVKGIGIKAAEELAANQPYKNIDDLAARTNVSGSAAYRKDGSLKGVINTLNEKGYLYFD